MKKLIIVALSSFVISSFALSVAYAGGSHYVKGYVKKDGTYVEPHYQTNPDSTKLNNYSTEGNVNPYTGKEGTEDPYKVPEQPKKSKKANDIDPLSYVK
jgi:hypothetical protein